MKHVGVIEADAMIETLQRHPAMLCYICHIYNEIPFETAIIEHYRCRESSVEEALIKMYLAGVSVRRVEDIIEALWRTKVSPGTISELNSKPMLASKYGEAAL